MPVGRRLARFLKESLRGYDFECVGVTGKPMMPTDHYPQTNHLNGWRRIRRVPNRRQAETAMKSHGH